MASDAPQIHHDNCLSGTATSPGFFSIFIFSSLTYNKFFGSSTLPFIVSLHYGNVQLEEKYAQIIKI